MHTFEITIQRKVDDHWPIVVEQGQAGVFLPIRDEGALHLDLTTLLSQADPLDYGTVLGQALFRDDIRDAFVRARADSEDNLRVLLFVEDDELKSLRWERLCAPLNARWDFLTLDQRIYFSLYLPSVTDRRFPPIGRRDLRTLILLANPAGLERYGLAPFDEAAAAASLRTALGDIPAEVLGTVPGAVGPASLKDLCQRITAERYSLLHIVAHGQYVKTQGDTVIYLARGEAIAGDGEVDPVAGERLIRELGRVGGARGLPHLAFLSTCESASPEAEGALGGLAQRLVRELGMPAVVAMTDKVSVSTAQALAAAFYQRLEAHGEVDRALDEAYAGLSERYDVMVPALYSRLGGRPLFSDVLDRALTNEEIEFGLAQLESLVGERAPILQPSYADLADLVRGTLRAELAALSATAREERSAALTEINNLCQDVTDLSFNALALGQEPPAYDSRVPFRGLYPFRAEDQAFFFGREALVQQFRQQLAEHNLLAVLGPSGSGKSSLVLAGLVPALLRKEPSLALAYMTPGNDPLPQLAVALASAGLADRQGPSGSSGSTLFRPTQPPDPGQDSAGDIQNEAYPSPQVILVVDQFEEVFTLCPNEEQRQQFFERLLDLSQRMPVVITMRADFWGECAIYAALKEVLQANQELIGPMQTADLRRAMEQQAAKVGLRFEADLSNTILDDVRGEPGAMPLLQHALLEMWQRRHGRWLRAEEYRTLGGVQKAIASTAEKIYQDLPATEQALVRDIFVRLTRLDEETVQGEERRDTRRRVRFEELVPAGGEPGLIKQLVQRLADVRLVVTGVNQATDQEEVEVAHEALIRHWPRLRQWLDEDRNLWRVRQRIGQDAREWETGGRRDDLLPRWSARLEEAIDLSRQARFALNALEQSYLDACVDLRDRERAEQERQQREKLAAAEKLAAEQQQRLEEQRQAAANLRSRARLLAVVGAVAVLLAIAAGMFGLQSNQNAQRANAESTRAIASEGTAEAERATAEIAQQIAETERSEAERQARIAHSRRLVAQAQKRMGSQLDLALLLIVAANQRDDNFDARSSLLDGIVASRYLKMHLRGHTDIVRSIAFSPDGEILASSSYDGSIILWDYEAARPLSRLPEAHTDWVLSVAFSPAGQMMASSSQDGTIRLWDVSDPTAPQAIGQPLQGHTEAVNIVTFNPDATLLAAGSDDSTITLWDLGTGQPVDPPLTAHSEGVYGISFSPDGRLLASGSLDGRIILWDVITHQPLDPPLAERAGQAVYSVAFSPDGRRLAAAGGESLDFSVNLWDVASRQPLDLPFKDGHTLAVSSLVFSPDGQTLASGSWDNTIILWDAETGQRRASPLTGHGGGVRSLAFSPDGKVLASGGEDQTIGLWDTELQPSLLLASIKGHARSIQEIAISPNGDVMATASDDMTIRLWDVTDVADPKPLEPPLVGHDGVVLSVAFSPDGKTLASGGYNDSVMLWDVATHQPLDQARAKHAGAVSSVAFSPDGRRLASAAGGEPGRIIYWTITPSRTLELASVQDTDQAGKIAFSPDGQLLASSGGLKGNPVMWDVTSGQPLEGFNIGGGGLDLAFSPDGTLLALTGIDGKITLWDAAARRMIGPLLTGEEIFITDVAFSPDGQRLASVTREGILRLWDVARREPLGPALTERGTRVGSLAFSPDNKMLVVGARDGTTQLWDMDIESWQARACAIAHRNLSPAEWVQFMGEEVPYERICLDLPPGE